MAKKKAYKPSTGRLVVTPPTAVVTLRLKVGQASHFIISGVTFDDRMTKVTDVSSSGFTYDLKGHKLHKDGSGNLIQVSITATPKPRIITTVGSGDLTVTLTNADGSHQQIITADQPPVLPAD